MDKNVLQYEEFTYGTKWVPQTVTLKRCKARCYHNSSPKIYEQKR